MSSSRKRAAILRAQAESERLRQQLVLTQYHYNVLKSVSEVIAARCQTAEDLLHEAVGGIVYLARVANTNVDKWEAWNARAVEALSKE